MSNKEKFFAVYNKYIKREGSKELLQWLESTDFFTAPASTRYHEAYAGGLVEHSVRVWNELIRLLKAYPELKVSAETAAIVSLLHDVCKISTYKVELRNKKDEFGQWVKYPVYTHNEDFKFGGHGSKSVYLIQKYMQLTDTERVAIKNHMGRSDGDYAVYDAFRAFPLAFLIHSADMAATIDTFKGDK